MNPVLKHFLYFSCSHTCCKQNLYPNKGQRSSVIRFWEILTSHMSRSSSHSRNNLPQATSSARIRIGNEGALEREYDRDGPIPCSLSLLSARRPSLALSPYDNPQDIINAGLASYRDVPKLGIPSQLNESSSPEFDGGNLRKNFQIIMKDLVGDAVGNVSCSPYKHPGNFVSVIQFC